MPKVASARIVRNRSLNWDSTFWPATTPQRASSRLSAIFRRRTVLEIGPGARHLTSLLAKRARRLIAMELDRVLAAQLRMNFGMCRNVEIIEADVLAIDFDTLFGPKPGLARPGIELKPRAGERRGQSSLFHHVRHPAAAV